MEITKKIEIQNLSKSFHQNGNGDNLLVLDKINFSIMENDFVCILGESGCGKSTLFKILSGLELPSEGFILINGEEISEPSSQVGLVFQNHRLMPWLSVQKNIELGYKIRKEKIPKEKIRKVIELVGIEGFEKNKPNSLSGGMAQRVSLARAIVSEPSILLMDEPFGALDALTRLRLQKELTKIWLKNKITVVFITHDIDEAIMLATKILVLTPRPAKIRRLFQIPLSYPRDPRESDFLRLKGELSAELTMY